MAVALAFLKKAWPYLLAVAVVFGALYGAYHHGVTVTTAQYERTLADERTANAQALAQAHADARTIEQDAAQRQAQVETQLIQRNKDAQDIADRTIADLRAGTLQLRKSLTAGTCSVASVSGVAASTAERDAVCNGGFQLVDAAILVRFAARAQQVAERLKAAQAVIADDRKICGQMTDDGRR
ncbi:DUF2514 family protein [Tardiphaga sp. 20_F10_N6_6]|uniref:DUF2514 family protein n=1 Tax=Tardiphaga sp. 20_F10_N6_6 TaxID=3240788 RepID=UPI003F8A1D40